MTTLASASQEKELTSQNYNVRKLINPIYSSTYSNSHSLNNLLFSTYTIPTFNPHSHSVSTFNDNNQQAIQWLMQVLTMNTGCPSLPQFWNFLGCETYLAQTGTVPDRWDSWLLETHDSSCKGKVTFPSPDRGGTRFHSMRLHILCDTDGPKHTDTWEREREWTQAQPKNLGLCEWMLNSFRNQLLSIPKDLSPTPHSFLHPKPDLYCGASGVEIL